MPHGYILDVFFELGPEYPFLSFLIDFAPISVMTGWKSG